MKSSSVKRAPISQKPVYGYLIDVDSSVATSAFDGTNVRTLSKLPRATHSRTIRLFLSGQSR